MKVKISAAISPCPNDIYIFSGLILGKIKLPGAELDFRFHDIETLNRLALDSGADLVKVSAALWEKISGPYTLLATGGAMGLGCGPLLLRNPVKPTVDGGEIWVPGENTTANLLLDFYLEGKGVRKKFLPFDALYRDLKGSPGAMGVVIHENRFTYEKDGLALVSDLGEHWEVKTGLPIPLGVIGLKKNTLPASELEAAIRDSMLWAQKNPQETFALCRSHSQSMELHVMQAHVDLYVNKYTRDLGEGGRKALEALGRILPK